jgi:hypothetical protein
MAENAFSRIEQQLAAALQDTEPTQAPAVKSPDTVALTPPDDDPLSARELRQMAYDRVEQELAQLHRQPASPAPTPQRRGVDAPARDRREEAVAATHDRRRARARQGQLAIQTDDTRPLDILVPIAPFTEYGIVPGSALVVRALQEGDLAGVHRAVLRGQCRRCGELLHACMAAARWPAAAATSTIRTQAKLRLPRREAQRAFRIAARYHPALRQIEILDERRFASGTTSEIPPQPMISTAVH